MYVFFFFLKKKNRAKGETWICQVDTAKSVKSWEVKKKDEVESLLEKAAACASWRALLEEADVCVNMPSLKLLIDFL